MISTDSENLRVLLIVPPGNYIPGHETKHCVQPLGIAYIGSVLERAGYEIAIIDSLAEGYENEAPIPDGYVRYGLGDDEIRSRVESFQPDIVGVSCPQSTRHYHACKVLEVTKEVNHNILTLMGGAHASSAYRELVMKEYIDLVIVGEGEETVKNVCDRYVRGERDFSGIPGLAFRDHGGAVIFTGKGRIYKGLNTLPFPAYHLLPMDLYSKVGMTPASFTDRRRFSILISSRGCPNNCDYCPAGVTFGHEYRKRSVENVIEEILYLRSEFDIEEILFEDSNFLYDRKRIIDLCREMKKRIPGLVWSCPHGLEVSRLDDELLKIMISAGCDTLYLAVETMNESISGFQPNKKVKDDHLRSIITRAQEMGVRVVCFFMLGFPGENREDLDKTLSYAKTLDLDYVCFFCATPLPGTRLFELCRDKNMLRPDLDFPMLRYSKGNIRTDSFSWKDVEFRRRSGWKTIMAGKEKK
ncbi:MAG: radical SAM protein [Thermodesulfobacteriota bacterium]|nr:radical SAM protein [Thermodesulfobacteriota bacterium]